MLKLKAIVPKLKDTVFKLTAAMPKLKVLLKLMVARLKEGQPC